MQEKSKVNIFFPNNDGNQFKTFLEGLFPDKEVNIVKNWKDTPLSLIVFTGGEDVTPSFYGENVGKHTFTNTMRDQNEFDIFHTIFYGTPKLGICRGAQFLTVAAGGKLIQHVEGHRNTTDKITLSSEHGEYIIEVPSDHHQMMFPYNLNKTKYEILGHSTYFKSSVYLNGENENIVLPNNFLEPEIVYYSDYNSLAIQSHPEWISNPADKSLQVIYNIIRKTILKNK